jgi:hypothetical protein
MRVALGNKNYMFLLGEDFFKQQKEMDWHIVFNEMYVPHIADEQRKLADIGYRDEFKKKFGGSIVASNARQNICVVESQEKERPVWYIVSLDGIPSPWYHKYLQTIPLSDVMAKMVHNDQED